VSEVGRGVGRLAPGGHVIDPVAAELGCTGTFAADDPRIV
jgi:hypothetical protein